MGPGLFGHAALPEELLPTSRVPSLSLPKAHHPSQWGPPDPGRSGR